MVVSGELAVGKGQVGESSYIIYLNVKCILENRRTLDLLCPQGRLSKEAGVKCPKYGGYNLKRWSWCYNGISLSRTSAAIKEQKPTISLDCRAELPDL